LTRAIKSALAQEEAGDFHIIVGDDASPVPARDELAAFSTLIPDKISIIEKANGGPGSARNAALDSLPDTIGLVAFLDSDDEWTEYHLKNARAALDAGHDFYFADHFHLGSTISAFNRAGHIIATDFPEIAGGAPLHAFNKDMADQILCGNVIGTSTVVFRFSAALRNIRFKEVFRRAGEDYIFWLDCAQAGAAFAFSDAVECSYGKGVNVYSGSGWDSGHFLDLMCDEVRYRRFILRKFPLSDAQARHLKTKINDCRENVALFLLGSLKKGAWRDIKSFFKYCTIDKPYAVLLPFYLARAVFKKLRR
jgi:succinoglycan biosynthesis protein ExoW